MPTRLSADRVRENDCCEETKDFHTVESFAEYLKSHGGRVENIKLVSMDMSAAFKAGFRQNFPNAEITFDKFHLSNPQTRLSIPSEKTNVKAMRL